MRGRMDCSRPGSMSSQGRRRCRVKGGQMEIGPEIYKSRRKGCALTTGGERQGSAVATHVEHVGHEAGLLVRMPMPEWRVDVDVLGRQQGGPGWQPSTCHVGRGGVNPGIALWVAWSGLGADGRVGGARRRSRGRSRGDGGVLGCGLGGVVAGAAG